MTQPEIDAEIARLRAKEAARIGKVGFEANIAAIRERIAELQAMEAE